jgi:hypothetical protein
MTVTQSPPLGSQGFYLYACAYRPGGDLIVRRPPCSGAFICRILIYFILQEIIAALCDTVREEPRLFHAPPQERLGEPLLTSCEKHRLPLPNPKGVMPTLFDPYTALPSASRPAKVRINYYKTMPCLEVWFSFQRWRPLSALSSLWL